MNTLPRLLLALASSLAAAYPAALSAAPTVEETTLVADVSSAEVTLSSSGVHVAAVIPKGSRQAVVVDGVEGPRFDQIASLGGVYDFDGMGGRSEASHQTPPVHTGRLITGLGAGGGNQRIIFNRDGTHYAYVGRSGNDFVLMLDNKEVHRGPYSQFTWLAFTPDGKRLIATATDKDGVFTRVLIDGQPGPDTLAMGSAEVFVSADGAHYAYIGTNNDAQQTKWMVVDGRQVKYLGDIVGFTSTGALLTRTTANYNQILLANGKVMAQASAFNYLALHGNRLILQATPPLGNPPRQQPKILTVDGQPVAGAEDVTVIGSWASPDGKRWAVLCQQTSPVMESFMIVDGKRELGYSSIYTTAPYAPSFSPDSSKFVYVAMAGGGGLFVVVNGEESDAFGTLAGPFWSETGSRLAYGGTTRAQKPVWFVDGKSIPLVGNQPPNSTFRFTPDGTHHMWSFGPPNGLTLVVDGKPIPDVGGSGFIGAEGVDGTNLTVRLSPDGKHVAYAGIDPKDNSRRGLWVDGKLITPITLPQLNRVTFSPDSQHIAYAVYGVKDNLAAYRVFVDGQEVLSYASTQLDNTPGAWEMGADGTLTLLGVDDGALKRYRIMPSSDTTLATLVGSGNPAAAPPPAVAGTPPPSPAAAKPPSSTPVAATPLPSAATRPAPAATSIPAHAAAFTPLTWNDLVRRPEARPATCTVNKEFRFQNGAVVKAGTLVNVIEANGTQLGLGTLDGQTNFGARPEETDILAVANAAWAQLTPAQRDLTYQALNRRMDLWPYHIKLLAAYTFQNGQTKPGDSALFLGFEGSQPLVMHEATKTLFNVETVETDIMAQARATLVTETGAPGRLVEELSGKLVSPLTNAPVALDLNSRPKYVVMYRGAGWCGPCQVFSPQLVKLLGDKAPAAADVALIYISSDRSPAEAKAYVTKIGIDWPTLYYSRNDQLPAFNSFFGDSIPQLVVADRHGKVLIDSARVGQAQALQQLAKLL